MRSNIQHACATYLILHGVNSLQVLTLLFVHKGLLSTKPSLLSAGVPYTPALFFPYSLRSFPEARLSETGLPRITETGSSVSEKNPLGNRGLPLTSLVLSVMFKIVQARGQGQATYNDYSDARRGGLYAL